MAKKETEYCRYTSTKLDADVIPIVKAAAALSKKTIQEWLSDVANVAASGELGRKPLQRKPPKPRDDEN